MKSLKKIVAAVLSVAMLGAVATTSFAASLDYENEIQFSATVSPATVAPGEDVTISFYMKDITNNETLTMSAGGSYGVDFAVNEILTFKSAAIGQDFGTESLAKEPVEGFYITLLEPSSEANVTSDAPIFTYVFTVSADAAAGTYDLITDWSGAYVGDGDGYEAGDYSFDASAAKITVAGGNNDKVTTEDTLTDGEGVVEFDYAADYAGNKAFEGKKVIFQNVETTRGNIKADTKVKVTRKSTNEVKYFGEKLYANWGVEGEGELAAKTIAFGLVIDAELDAADFEFVIE